MDFQIRCDCDNQVLMDVKNASVQAWHATIAQTGMRALTCSCGCVYDLVAAQHGVGQTDISTPMISAVSPSSGARTGGTAITITAHALDVGTPVVKIGGVTVQVSAVTADSCAVIAPACPRANLRVQGAMTGSLHPGDAVTGSISGHAGTFSGFTAQGSVVILSPTGGFQAGEWLQKDAGNKIQLAAQNHWDGAVDVTVENEFGQHPSQAILVRGFTYLA